MGGDGGRPKPDLEDGAAAFVVFDPDAAAVLGDDALADGEAETDAFGLVAHGIAELTEAVEHGVAVGSTDAGAVVGHRELDLAAGAAERERGAARSARREFHRIAKQIDEHLHQPVVIADDLGGAGRNIDVECDVGAGKDLAHGGRGLPYHGGEINELGPDGHRPGGLDLAQMQQLADEAGEAFGFGDDDGEKFETLAVAELRVVTQDFGEGPDRGERRSKLVIDRGDEIVLEAIELLEAGIGFLQLGGGRLERQ